MPKKRYSLLVINQFASAPENLYGAGERFYHLAPYFERSGFATTIISGGYNHLFKSYPDTKGMFTSQSFPFVEFIWIRLRAYKYSSFLGRVISWFEFLIKLFFYRPKNKPDIVLVSSMSLLPIIYAIWLQFRYKAKFVLEVRDIWPLTPIQIGGYSKAHPILFFLRQVELLGYRKADAIVSVLPGFGRYLDENGFGFKPFKWIPNGVLPMVENGQQEHPITLDKAKFNVVYTGTIGKANALEDLVEAAALLSYSENIHINIVGDGPFRGELEHLSRNITNITFFEKVSKRDLGAILKQADVCYIGWHNRKLYEYGVSANKYNDYMFASKPILSSSNIVDDPVLMSNSGIQVKANSPEAIAQGILSFYKMPLAKRAELGKNGYDFVLSNQTYPTLAKKYITVLNGFSIGHLKERL